VHERVLLVGLGLKRPARVPGYSPGDAARDSLDELAELSRSAGATVAGSLLQMRESADPATLVGRGKIEEIRAQAQACEAALIVFDGNLTPAQQRNLERELDCRVIDRTQLILDIFARHARSREGQLQVELAQLNYLMPRLAGGATELSRLGGGIGTRGPGEQKLRPIAGASASERAASLKPSKRYAASEPCGGKREKPYRWGGILVGYTNAGKSTLFNALSSGRRAGFFQNVCHARSHVACRAFAIPPPRALFRYRGIHSRSAQGFAGSIQSYARGSAAGGIDPARHRRRESASR
jgi:GTP-binding protein HflX